MKTFFASILVAGCLFIGCTDEQAACVAKCEDAHKGDSDALYACQEKCKPDTELPAK
jgi:hypothetical protein